MERRVIITGPAESDVLSNHAWWAENRSEDQAIRWLEGIYDTMLGLANTADVHPLATETALRKAGIKQASFGLGRRPTHRIVFSIDGNSVIIFRVRAFKQQEIDLGDLE